MYNANRVESTRRAGNQNIVGGLSAIAQMYLMKEFGGYPSTGVKGTLAELRYKGMTA